MLRVKGLCYKQILQDITFTVPDGSFTIIVGKNGSGKSCLLRCIKDLYKHSGEVECNGSCALVFQDADTQIIGQTVEKDLSFALRGAKPDIDSKVKAFAQEFDLLELLDRRPSGLSGGEKRRLAIADVAITNPSILMLDEPFANLDYPGIKSVVKLLIDLKSKGVTIILVSHEVEKILALADQIVILEKGKILIQGSADEVFEKADWDKAGIRVNGKREEMLWV